MSKKIPQRQQFSVQKKVNRPVEIRTIDELSVLSEEELQGRAQFLHDELYNKRIAPLSREAAPWEVELAYVQREQDIRRTRKLRHREYMDTLRSEEVDESTLPEYQGNPPPIW